jgi:hypothetical protein
MRRKAFPFPDGGLLKLTKRDESIVESIVRWGALTINQIVQLHFGNQREATVAAYARLKG